MKKRTLFWRTSRKPNRKCGKSKVKSFKIHLNLWLCNVMTFLRHIASFQLPPVYPWMLQLTDAGPGVGVSSEECRWRLLEKARIHNSDKVLRIHRAREYSDQNEAEGLNACIADAPCDGGTLK